ncbi:MAG: type IV secretion protein Rhs, partial [Gammaproteobacteria bacterium]|nr:type IV secretion protein Rhs [Gammaproteobacteria bacterium]
MNQGASYIYRALPDATEGEEYRFTFAGEDEDVGDFVVFQASGTLPEGATLNEMTGEFIWTPPFGSAGTLNIGIRFEDLRGSGDSRGFPLVINPSNQPNTPPTLDAIADQQVKLDDTLQLTARATDAENHQLFYTLLQNPSGMTIDQDSGLIDWTPSAAQAGEHLIRLSATDIREAEDSISFTVTVTVNSAPEIVGTAPARATVGVNYAYNLMASDADGDALAYQLISGPAGMSVDGNGLVSWLPGASHLPQQQAVIEVSDGQITLTLTLTIPVVESNTAPFITSSPVTSIVADDAYAYAVQAFDNENDTLVYQLNAAPAGMTINSASGVVSWSPGVPDLGTHAVEIEISDGRGGGAQQNYTLVVNDGVSNLPPEITSLAPQFVVEGQLFSYTVVASDPDGDSLTTSLTQAPSGSTLNGDTIEWTPAIGGEIPRYEDFRVEVSDGDNTAFQNFFVAVVDSSFDPLALIATLSLTRTEYELDELLVVQVAASGPGTIDKSLTINGVAVEITDTGEAFFRLDQPGSYRILFTATNGVQTDSAEEYVSVIDPSDVSFPLVEIQSPTQQETITSQIDIVGTAADDNLRYYQLSYQRADAKTATFLPRQSASVIDGVLGSFDASLLLNGVYYIALTAVDINGHQSQESIAVIVDGQIKIGNFSVTLEDLSIPVTGIPVRITRTYDTRRKHERLDFGYGWSIDYQNVQVTETRVPGVAWRLNEYRSGFQNSTINFCVQPLGQPQVVVNLPDGDIETFDVRAEPECQLYIPRIDVQMAFEPTSGTTASLELQGDPVLRLANGNLVEIGESVDQGIDPSLYKLTTKSGMTYLLDQDFGITRVIDINDNTLTYSDDGIVHSSGKSIDFIRDAQGRITRITDPMGQAINYGYTNAGDLDTSTDREGNTTTYEYDATHGLTDLIDPLGRPIIKNFYDADGRLEAQEDNDGNRTGFVHDLTGRTSEVTDRLGRITQFAYDVRGNVTSEVDALGNLTSYTYDVDDNQTSQTDALGNLSMATWDDQRNQLSQIDELGRDTSFTYNQWGKELTITDAKQRSYRNTYDVVGNLLYISMPGGYNAGSLRLNVKGLVTRMWDTYSKTTDFTYDDDGNKLTEIDSLGNLTTFTYDDNGNVLTETVQRTIDGLLTDETTTFLYDALDRVIQTTDALGNVTQMVYDAVGNKVQDIDALGRVTDYTYDPFRRMTRTDYPDGSFTSMTYDAEGNLATETDANGYTTSYVYDALNRLTITTYADSTTTQTSYDVIGRVLTETDARGNVTTYGYDAAGQRINTTNALSEETSFTYDDNGNLETMTDGRSNTWQYAYDVYDNRTVTTWPDGSTSDEVTDRLGRITEKTDQNDNSMTFDYDALGRLLGVTDALNQVTTYSYDEVGNKLSQTDAENRTTSWTYDALGRELTRTLPLGQIESQQYDAVGNRISSTDFNSQLTSFVYDNRDRLDSVTYNDASVETSSYDNHGNRTGANDRSSSTQGWSFDNRHRLIQVIDAAANRIDYQYDVAGNKTQQTTTPAGGSAIVTTYAYDALNRLQSVTDSSNQVTSYAYDANGNRASVTYPNGNVTSYVYDVNNRLTGQTTEDSLSTVIADYQYTLDPSGHRLQIDELGRGTSYTYDASYKLLSEAITDAVNGNHNASYLYDNVGNRTDSTINGVQTLYTYDDNDRLLQQGGEVFTYDNNGNTLSKTIDGFQSTYGYDAKNLVSSALINNGGVVTNAGYQYDVDGIRIQKTEDSNTVDYLIDPNHDNAQVIRETDSTSLINIDYLYGDDLIQQSQASANERYYIYDGLGSTRLLSDSTSVITDTYDYEAFGSVLNQSGVTQNNYQFTGEQYDSALDQYYLRARYYDPKSARFTQRDNFVGVISDPISLHKYLYANSNPVNLIDPSGNFSIGGLLSGIRTVAILARTSSGRAFLFEASKSAAGTAITSREAGFLVLAGLGGAASQVTKWLKNKTEEDNDGPDETYYHGTTSNAASKILKKGFRDIPTFFAEDRATAQHFARQKAAENSARSTRVLTLTIPKSIRLASGMVRGPIGGDLSLPFIDISGGTG